MGLEVVSPLVSSVLPLPTGRLAAPSAMSEWPRGLFLGKSGRRTAAAVCALLRDRRRRYAF
eukprot:8398384-Prorocentrum_lima.AAC.1